MYYICNTHVAHSLVYMARNTALSVDISDQFYEEQISIHFCPYPSPLHSFNIRSYLYIKNAVHEHKD